MQSAEGFAAVLWSVAQWPIDVNNDHNLRLNARKRECYLAYARLADHRVEAVWIKVPGGRIPAWFHLPPGYRGGRLPVVIAVPGMDSFKEISVSLNGDRWLSRGMAVLAIDGPGQYESAVVGVPVTMEAWMATGNACVNWLTKRKEIDASRIGINGLSFGTFFATIAAARSGS